MDNSNLIVAALVATAPHLIGGRQAQDAYAKDLEKEGAKVTLYRRYEEGNHRAVITSKMREMLRLEAQADDKSGIQDFTDNYCSIIVDKMASRLNISNISIENEAVDESWLIHLLQQNSWEALQSYMYRSAVRDGYSFLLVDPYTLKWTSEPAYDGFSGMVTIFDEMGKTPIWACKLWVEDIDMKGSLNDTVTSTMHLVVYEPDRITHWSGYEGGREVTPLNIYPDDDVVVVTDSPLQPFVDMPVEVEPSLSNVLLWSLGKIPIIRIANKLDNYSNVGKSELHSAITLQDVLNRTLHSMVMASEMGAFNIKWAIGIDMDPKDIVPGGVINLTLTGEDGNTVISPESAAYLSTVKVGQFEATNIQYYIDQIDRLAREISQVTSTPIYGVTTQGVLSGEALKQLEIGLIGKVERFQKQNTDSIKQLILITAEMQNIFQTEVGGTAPILSNVKVIWQPAELIDTAVQVETLLNVYDKYPGLWSDSFYRRQIGSLLGMSSDEIRKEGDLAVQERSFNIDNLIGAGGRTIPVI